MRLLYYTLISARPTTWIRIFAEMLFGAAFSIQAIPHFSEFLIGFIASGCFLWSGAYILNDISDITYDRNHILRKNRPITSKLLMPNHAVYIAGLLIAIGLSIGLVINIFFFLGSLGLIISQIVYTFKPFRLKERFLLDIGNNGLNAGIRFFLGYVSVNGNPSHIPLGFILVAVTIKIILFIGHRMQSRSLEKQYKFHSTVVQFSLRQIKIIIVILFSLTALFYYLSAFYLYSKNTILLFAPVISFMFIFPLFIFIKKGYFSHQEEKLTQRIYIYMVFFIFSLIVFLDLHYKEIFIFNKL